jgi:excisionase family DNA binding protein
LPVLKPKEASTNERFILSFPEVAKYLKVSRSKVYYLVQQKKIPHVRIGKNVRITERDLMAWLDENRVGRLQNGRRDS